MSLLGLQDTLDGLARASGVRWYGHVLRRDNGDALGRALDFEETGRRGCGRPNVTVAHLDIIWNAKKKKNAKYVR